MLPSSADGLEEEQSQSYRLCAAAGIPAATHRRSHPPLPARLRFAAAAAGWLAQDLPTTLTTTTIILVICTSGLAAGCLARDQEPAPGAKHRASALVQPMSRVT